MAALIKEFAHYMRELGDTTELCLDSEVLQRDGFGKGSTKNSDQTCTHHMTSDDTERRSGRRTHGIPCGAYAQIR